MRKIRTLVAHNNEQIRNAIVNSITDLEYIDIVGVAANGMDTYNKIINLKPEVVFSEYNYSDMSGLELIKKTKEKLQNDFPTLNTIDSIPDNELMEVIHVSGDKLNASVREPSEAKKIMEAYKIKNQ